MYNPSSTPQTQPSQKCQQGSGRKCHIPHIGVLLCMKAWGTAQVRRCKCASRSHAADCYELVPPALFIFFFCPFFLAPCQQVTARIACIAHRCQTWQLTFPTLPPRFSWGGGVEYCAWHFWLLSPDQEGRMSSRCILYLSWCRTFSVSKPTAEMLLFGICLFMALKIFLLFFVHEVKVKQAEEKEKNNG